MNAYDKLIEFYDKLIERVDKNIEQLQKEKAVVDEKLVEIAKYDDMKAPWSFKRENPLGAWVPKVVIRNSDREEVCAVYTERTAEFICSSVNKYSRENLVNIF